jgi:hypothetical protein
MRFRDPAKAKEFFDQKMIFTTGPVELNRMLKDENVNVVDVRAADDFRQRSCARRGKFAQGKWDASQGLKKTRSTSFTATRSNATWQRMPHWSSPAGTNLTSRNNLLTSATFSAA